MVAISFYFTQLKNDGDAFRKDQDTATTYNL